MTDRRRWPLLAAQLAPLAVFAAIALVVVSVPSTMWSTTAGMFSNPKVTLSSAQLRQMVSSEDTQRIAKEAELFTGSSTSLANAIDFSWQLTATRQSEFVSTATIAPLPFSFDATPFAPIRVWESRHDATVWAWLVRPAPIIPLVAQASADATTMKYMRRNVAPMLPAENATGTSTWTDPLGRTAAQLANVYIASESMPFGPLAPLEAQQYQPTGSQSGSTASGSDMGDDVLYVSRATVAHGGRIYRVVVAFSGPESIGEDPIVIPHELLDTDPASFGFASLVKRVAARDKRGVWVFGPVTSTSIPFRAPSGVSTAVAAQLGSEMWPSFEAASSTDIFDAMGPLPRDAARLTGGRYGAMRIESSDVAGNPIETGSGPAPQTIVYLAVFRDVPGGAPSPLRSAFGAWSVWIGGYFPLVIGGLFAMLAVSLVVSPVAFVYDRRLRARTRVREEMERMQRDAHDKVYNRLSALSKRVAAVSESARSDLAASLSEIAEDIRGTVGELQDILGDEGVHTDASLATLPLAEQISAVGRAQAARLGVQVVFRAPDDLPAVSARAGWDLQCIAEEAITNAVRHGHARTIEVSLEATATHVVLRVADDGSGASDGISIDELPEGSTGLRGAAARMAHLGGSLAVSSSATGVVVVAAAPLGESPRE